MNLREQIEGLDDLTTPELAAMYLHLHGRPPRCRHRQWLRKRVAFKLQENAYGGLSSVAKTRLEELMQEIDPSLLAERGSSRSAGKAPSPGTTITKVWHGERHVVHVLTDGFEWNDQHYRSLSAVAKAITGAHWNGKVFFGIKKTRVS